MRKLMPFKLVLILSIVCQSCVSFKEGVINTNTIQKNNITELNGTFNNSSVEYDSVTKTVKNGQQFLYLLERNSRNNSLRLDSLKTYHFELEILDNKLIRFAYIENDSIFKEKILEYKLKKDGYVYLKNKNLKFRGVPYIMGGIELNKTRLTLDSDKNLIVDTSTYYSGAAFLVVFGGSRTYPYRLKYNRVE